MAHCDHCGKTTTFGRNVSFSKRHTSRTFRPNLQKTTVLEAGQRVQKTLCAKCIKAMSKLK
ncbi:MAG: 50S ribosomal protein L28 [Anaerolineales bacterium]|nr:50S ribosomal protein L28 [Anaerolineales bacterium]